MNTYTVEIKEVLRRRVDIEAYSEAEAHDKVIDMYYDGDIVMDSDDVSDGETEFCVVGVRWREADWKGNCWN